MTLENYSLELVSRLKALHESTADLFRLITEDRPYEHSLAHRYEHSTSEMLGRLEAALNAANVLQQTSAQFDHGRAFEVLGICHAEFNLVDKKFHNELKSFDWLQDLQSLEYEHPKEWMGWAASIKATLNQCNFSAVHEELLRCWQSLLVSSGAISTRQVKDIGWQITVPGSHPGKVTEAT